MLRPASQTSLINLFACNCCLDLQVLNPSRHMGKVEELRPETSGHDLIVKVRGASEAISELTKAAGTTRH